MSRRRMPQQASDVHLPTSRGAAATESATTAAESAAATEAAATSPSAETAAEASTESAKAPAAGPTCARASGQHGKQERHAACADADGQQVAEEPDDAARQAARGHRSDQPAE